MIRDIDPRKPAFECLRISKGSLTKYISLVKKSGLFNQFSTSDKLNLRENLLGDKYSSELVSILEEEYPATIRLSKYPTIDLSAIRLIERIKYLAWASVIYLKEVENLKDILYELSIAKITFTWTRKTLFGKDYLKYLTEKDEDGKGNYLDIVPVVKILSEYMDLPLKGKSLEEYKKAIIETCKEMIKEEKEGKNEP
jgi:hypothetical protein